MKVGQNFLLAALVAVLAVIAYDLHRLTTFVVPSRALTAQRAAQASTPPETREQRTARVRREAAEMAEDLKAILEDPKPAPRKAAPPSGLSAR